MRQRVITQLKELDAISVENPVYPGTPDVNHTLGWLELKREESWPARGGILAVPHFTPQQRVWLKRRSKKGGLAQLLIQVDSDWILLDGAVAADSLGFCTREELFERSVWRSSSLNSGLVTAIREAFKLNSRYTFGNVDPA